MPANDYQLTATPRRSVLRMIGGLTALSASSTGIQTATATATADNTQTKRIDRHIEPDTSNWVYVPFDVDEGVTELHVKYEYNKSQTNLLDIGIFDPDGYDAGNADGFRGWSGGERTEFTISRSSATPGYYPGEITPGTWTVILGPYRVGAGGIDYTLTVTLRSGTPEPVFEPQPAPDGPLTDTADWYRGDLHIHTEHSDGDNTPQAVVNEAADAGLDFFVSTEHNTTTTSLVWGNYARPDLLIIDGEEITTRAGHFNAVGLEPGQWIDWRYQPADERLNHIAQEIHDVGGITVANHPFCPYKGCDWRFGYESMNAIEVWNGSWTWEDEAALQTWDRMLREQRALPVVGASDAHDPDDTIGHPQTVVRAEQLGSDAIIAAIEAGRAYIAESEDVTIESTVTADSDANSNSAGIGEGLRLERCSQTPITIRLEVTGASGTEATIHTQESIVKSAPIESTHEQLLFETNAMATNFVRVEIRQPDGTMVALTNPIFVREPWP